ncbi:MAG: hypothetical protein ABID09_06480, partial [Candidatus Omnitrophota bacterium]
MIEYQGFHNKRHISIKIISWVLIFSFMWNQIAYSADLFSFKPIQSPALQGALKGGLVKEEGIDVTNYDLFRYKKKNSGADKLLPSLNEQTQSGQFAPNYLKRQQNKHEEVIRQKEGIDDLVEDIANRKKREEVDLPLKKKRSGPTEEPAGRINYTLTDWDGNGNPQQINIYEYVGAALKSVTSYDISGLDVSKWVSAGREMKGKDGDKFYGGFGAFSKDELTDDRILQKAMYFGGAGNERIDYILRNYDENGIPTEVTIYDYYKDGGGGGDTLDETRTYYIANLDIDFNSPDWQSLLSQDRLKGRTVYEGAKGDERIIYALDNYFVDDEGNNTAQTVKIYDYDKDDDKGLDEVKVFSITGVAEENWLREDEDRLEMVQVYDGEKDKEKIQYILSRFSFTSGAFYAGERTEYEYEEGALRRTKTFNTSLLTSDQINILGTGILEETATYFGEENYEKVEHRYSLYDGDSSPRQRVDYIYEGSSLARTKLYSISGVSIDSEEFLQEESVYEGRKGRERIVKKTVYGSTITETTYSYERNERGIEYVSNSIETIYNSDNQVIERIEINNDLSYFDPTLGFDVEDQNANVRNRNIKTYINISGVETLMDEEDIVYSNYLAAGQAQTETRTAYIYNDSGVKVETEYREITNHSFNDLGAVERQTIVSYKTDGSGVRTFETIEDVEHRAFDYYGNILESATTVWADDQRTQILHHKVTQNIYDNILARKRGIASATRVTRYSALEEIPTNTIDRTENITIAFSEDGYAVRQIAYDYVMDYSQTPDPVETLISMRVIFNQEIDNRGNAVSQEVITFRVDYDAVGIETVTLVNYQEFTDREFDSRRNVRGQTVLTYDEVGGVLLDVQETRSFWFHSSGVARRQVIATYADLEKNDLIDIKVVENESIDTLGNIGKNTVTRYEEGSFVGNGVTYSNPIDRVVTIVHEFDIHGNAMSQEILREYFDEAAGEFLFSEATKVTNDEFDLHSRVVHSLIESYSDAGITQFVDLREITYLEYDVYGNALEQTIDTYGDINKTALVDHKVIVNEFDDVVARRRGNTSKSTVTRYQDTQETVLIDEVVTTTTLFDDRGNAIDQTRETSVYDDTAGELTLVNRRLIHNDGYNNRGDAHIQEITTYQIDFDDTTGDEIATLVNYQEYTNRVFDSRHNIENQMLLTYDEQGGTLLDCQEIRSIGFHSSGVFRKQIIATYLDLDRTELLDVDVIENKTIDSQGNVSLAVITRYKDAQIDQNGEGVITYSNEIDRQTITTTQFDIYGNALSQEILREYFDETVGEFLFSEATKVTNDVFDLHGRVVHSLIESYSDAAMTQFVDLRDITYLNYDVYGNALEQTIDTYGDINKTALIDHKVIVNEFDDVIARRRGNTSKSTVTRYQDTAETVLIDEVVTTTILFDDRGNAIDQTRETSVYDATAGALTLVNRRLIHNDGYNNRGDAHIQEITTYQIDFDDTTGDEIATLVNYQEYTNRVFDSRHNIENQMLLTYDEKGGTLLDCQEIRSIGFHSSGVFRKQIIATYSDASRTQESFLDVKMIENDNIDSNGDVGISVITRYENALIEGNGGGVIIYWDEIDHQIIETSEFDIKGNAIRQTITRENFDVITGGYILIDVQDIENLLFDIHDNIIDQTIETSVYDASISDLTVVNRRLIHNSDYTAHGNAGTQEITTYHIDGTISTLANHQVFTNRSFDVQRNVTNQMVLTYSDIAKTDLLDVQEIRSIDFHRSGVALQQIIATYTDETRSELLDVKVVDNDDIDKYGNVGLARITKYGSCVMPEGEAGTITYSDPVDKQVISVTDFDNRGNALAQTILRYYYDDSADVLDFVFSEAQSITNSGFDIYDRASRSVVKNYSNEAMTTFVDMQDIDYITYDVFGN